ncbi:hypothetical protein FBUS_07198 [Fasciolopsis buskii]|uniref:Uncharacterized protein n=1 Tax=Fasciolopsis buskii TaxID=27845 RepID=A0A8E0VN85_9TREM|nr:hypothetical protein FBUS_07198 [Fasciolopsis buski]
MLSEILTEHKSRFVFGSCHERELYPQALPHHRIGVTMGSIFGQGNASPASYNVDVRDSLREKPHSSKGYTLGARTAKRKSIVDVTVITPAPNAYQEDVTAKKPVRCNYKPFNHTCHRFEDPGAGKNDVAG